jgi:hypothetical protein
MPTLPNSTVFDWSHEGYEDGSDDGGPYVHIQAVVDWDVRFQFVNGIRSAPQLVGTPGVAQVLWAVPWPYPDSPNLFCFECRMVRGMGVPKENAAGGFDYVDPSGGPGKALYACTFRRPPYDLAGTDSYNSINYTSAMPNMSMRKRTSSDTENIPGFSLVWMDPADDPGDSGVAKSFPVEVAVTELIYTRHGLPYLPGGPLDDFVGCINSNTFEGYPPGQVKYMGISSDRQVDTGSGDTVQEIEVTFLRRPRDWNTMWSGVPGRGWQRVGSARTDPVFPYPYVDFNEVFANV